ncbi:DNA-damage-inducible F DinF domain protein [Mycobacterium ulcerans str. Harvey]|nr:DNA-damage-inducible F DinF domain protein [Mycobacterium ulcerans str. Harvey]
MSALLCPLLVYGWLGLPRMELAGSAVANLVGQWLAALLFGARCSRAGVVATDRHILREQLVLARDLIVRTMAFQACLSRPRRWLPGSALPLWLHTRWCCSCGVFALVLDSWPLRPIAGGGGTRGGDADTRSGWHGG